MYEELNEDQWCDLLHLHLGLVPEARHKIHDRGDLRFNQIIDSKLICISSFLKAWQSFYKVFPSSPEVMDNSWISQPLFHNSNSIVK